MNLNQFPARHGPEVNRLNFQGFNKPNAARCDSPNEARKQATPKRSRLAVSDGGPDSKELLGADVGEMSSRPVSAAGQVHLQPRTQSESQRHRSLEMLYDARCDSVFEHERAHCSCKQHQRSDCSRESAARFKSHSSSTLRQQQRSDTSAVSARAADCSHLSEGSHPLASTPYRLLGGQRKSSPLATHLHSERGSTACADEHVAHLPPSGPRSQSGSFRSTNGSLVHAHDTSSGSFRASNSSTRSSHDDSLGRSSTSRHTSGAANPVPLEQCPKCRNAELVERENDECDCEECSRELPDGEHFGADDGALFLAQTRSMEVHERPSEQRGRSRRRNCFSAHASMEDCCEESDADEQQVKSGSDSGNPCDELESSTPQRSARRSFCTQTEQPEQLAPARTSHPRTRDVSCQMDPNDELAENSSSRGDHSRRTDSSRSRSRSRALSIERGVALLHLSSSDSGSGSEAINSSGDRVRSSTRSNQSGSDSTVKDAAKTLKIHHFSQRLRPIRQKSKQAIVCTLYEF